MIRRSGAIYKSPKLPGLCARGGATGGRVVEPRRADYAYDCRRGARGPTLTEG